MFSKRHPTDEFEHTALPHLNELFRTAARLLGDSAKAEDVVQETYLQAWKSFDRFQSGTNCRAWLFKIMINTIHHHRRHWFNLRVVKDSEEILRQAEAACPVPAHLTETGVLEALERLPADYRAVVLLADVQELSYKEVAGVLEIPMGTVMSRLSRARRLLRESLGEIGRAHGIGQSGKQEHA